MNPTHVCLVYNTATAHVVPALDPATRPREVILVHGPDHRHRAESLAKVLRPTGIAVAFWPVEDIWDVAHLQNRLLELMGEYEGQTLALNASGGTRPMSMAAFEIFREFGLPVFYLHPRTDRLHWLHDRARPPVDCADRVKLPAFLRAHGIEPGERATTGIPSRLRELTEDLIRVVETIERPLSALNWLASQADNDRLRSPRLDDHQLRWEPLTSLIERFEAAGVLRFQGGALEFADEAARFYANGGWLEEHVFGLLYGLRKDLPQLQDVGRGVEILRDASGRAVKNEIDVVFLANNHVFLIECKTKRFAKQPDADGPGAEVLYKLDTLRGLFDGLRAHVMLVSYQALSDWDRQRAKDLGVEVCVGDRLSGLKNQLRNWITAYS